MREKTNRERERQKRPTKKIKMRKPNHPGANICKGNDLMSRNPTLEEVHTIGGEDAQAPTQ